MKTPLLLAVLLLPGVANVVHGQEPPTLPRRALVISVHDYLFANPVHPGEDTRDGHHIRSVVEKLSSSKALNIPSSQVLHLSDEAKQPQLPTKAVIEATLAKFLTTSRAQDQVLVAFVGHAIEQDGEAFLVPMEAELTASSSHVSLKTIFEQLQKCKARQKVLLLDICRQSATRGQLRPSKGPLSKELLEAIRKAPAGVQVWLACGQDEHSQEGEEGGVFLHALAEVLDRGGEQKPGELQVEALKDEVKRRLSLMKLSQQSLLIGTAKKEGAAFDPREAAPPRPTVEGVVPANRLPRVEVAKTLLREANVPAIRKLSRAGVDYLAESIPFAKDELDKVAKGDAPAKLQHALEVARAILWTTSGETPPADLATAVAAVRRSDAGVVLLPFAARRAPPLGGAAEKAFKTALFEQSRAIAGVLRLLEEALESLREAANDRAIAPRRWQAHLDYLTARTMMQIAFLYEYSSALGSMRKEFPPLDPKVHGGWVLASQARMAGDIGGRKMAREALKRFEQIIADYPGTPWELLARGRDRVTSLGLEWRPRR